MDGWIDDKLCHKCWNVSSFFGFVFPKNNIGGRWGRWGRWGRRARLASRERQRKIDFLLCERPPHFRKPSCKKTIIINAQEKAHFTRTSLVFKSTGLARRDPKLSHSSLSRLGFKTFIGYRWKKDHRLNHRWLWFKPWNTLPKRCHSPFRTKVLVSPSPLSTKSNWNSK